MGIPSPSHRRRRKRCSYAAGALGATLLGAVFALSGCGGGGGGIAAATPTPGPTPAGLAGIRGVAMEGPTLPVIQPGVSNTRPLAGAIITVQAGSGGPELARQRADSSGRFRIVLAAGAYLIVPLPPQPDAILPHGLRQPVLVRAGRFTDVTVQYDTGLR